MKKNKKTLLLIIIAVIIIICLAIGAVVLFTKKKNNSSDNIPYSSEYISKEEALNIALKDSVLNKEDVHDIEVELGNKYDVVVYEVSYEYNDFEYEYYIKATTGDILKTFRD